MASYSQNSSLSWALFKETIDNGLIKAAQPKIIYPKFAKTYPVTGPVVRIDDTQDSWINPGLIGEAAEENGAALNFNSSNISMKEIGVAPRLPMNWIEDSRIDLIDQHVEAIGLGMARYLNSDMLTGLNTWVVGGTYNGNTFNAVSNHDVSANAVWSSSSSDIIADIAAGLAALGADNVGDGLKYLVVHPTPFQYVMTDPNFLKYINYGNSDLVQKGIYPTPFGITFLVTNQAATDYALLVNVDMAAIKYYERKKLTTVLEKHERISMIDIIIKMRYAFHCGRPKAIYRINTIA